MLQPDLRLHHPSLVFLPLPNALINAIEEGNREKVYQLLQLRKSVIPIVRDTIPPYYYYPYDFDINFKFSYIHNKSLLHLAVEKGWLEIVDYLLKQGADINQCCDGGITALHLAVSMDNLALVVLLMRYGADSEISTLTSLCLDDNSCTANSVKNISEILKINKSLLKLSWANEYAKDDTEVLDDEKIEILADALKINQTLKILNLRNNQIGDAGVKCFLEILEINQTLEELDLSNNSITREGFNLFANFLKSNQTLTKIGLGGCKTNTEEIKTIADALKVNKSLKEINLYSNEINDVGAKYIAKMLKTNTTLQKLNLMDNEIGVEGFKKLIKNLKYNTTLIELNMTYFDNDNEECELVKIINKIIKRNQLIQEYPELKTYILKVSHKAGLYEPNLLREDNELMTLKNLAGLTVYYKHKWLLTEGEKRDFLNSRPLPDDLKKFVESISEFDAELSDIVDEEVKRDTFRQCM